MLDAYRRAARFMPWNARRYVLNLDVEHHWIGDEDRLWYRREGPDSTHEFVMIDAATGDRRPAFDHDALAALLSARLGIAVDAVRLPADQVEIRSSGDIRFTVAGQAFQWDGGAELTERRLPHPDEVVSPDGRWAAFVRGDDLWVRAVEGGRETRLTDDGEPHHGYAGISGDTANTVSHKRLGHPQPAQVAWSPDSSRLLTQRIDERLVNTLHLVDCVPPDGSLRPQLHSYRYPFPGDEHVAMATLIVFDVATGGRVDIESVPLRAEYLSPLFAGHAWWSADGAAVYFLARDQFSRTQSLFRADPATGRSSLLVLDSSATNATVHWHRRRPILRVLAKGEILWFSERDGWGHLYRYGADGALLNRVTSGEWLVRAIVHVDERRERLYFTAGGREESRNPYHRHLYGVDFDGGNLRLLTPEDADHLQTDVQDLLTPVDRTRLPFSASGDYFVDSFSRVDAPPELVLRRADGDLVATLEHADVSALTNGGMTLPEPFEVLAADGETALHGVLYRPSDFDPARRYPVIEGIYPGPQWGRTSQQFSSIFADAQALAELGFVVVTLDARGSRFRSKALWNQSYGRLGDAGMLVDHVAALRQLGERHAWIDLERVGIYGHSGGGNASARALMLYPEMYKVAVSVAGAHEQAAYLAWWGDLYNGSDRTAYDDTDNRRFVDRLRGRLLLIHGDMDDNVHPAHTLQLVDALMKANKDFDMLIVPGGNHHDVLSPYVERRRWDYFVTHLMRAQPAHEFQIGDLPDRR